jgi:23S rRNA pseudouridine1911/1915/1917 synthase
VRSIDYVCSEGRGRLDRYLADMLERVSRSEIQRWIAQGRVTVNGQTTKSSHPLSAGDVVHVEPPELADDKIVPIEMPLAVVYEDRDCVVIDKPAGLVVHPATSHRQDTLVNALLATYPEIADMADDGQPAGMRPGIVHRLDKDTSGLIVVARHPAAKRLLQAQFKAQSVAKTYLALVRLACPRQFLHAHRLAFDRISDGQRLDLESPLPEDLRQVLDQLEHAV